MSNPSNSAMEIREFSLTEIRAIRPIPSGYETDHTFHLQRHGFGDSITWRLREEHLARPFRKEYDSGLIDEWLESYEEQASLEEMRFLGLMVKGEVKGLATYCYMNWNQTLWLIDIRTEKASRREGIGSALVEEVKKVARQSTVRGVRVETQTNNYPAICFYRKHGFQVSGFDDHLYTNEDVETQDVAIFMFWETH